VLRLVERQTGRAKTKSAGVPKGQQSDIAWGIRSDSYVSSARTHHGQGSPYDNVEIGNVDAGLWMDNIDPFIGECYLKFEALNRHGMAFFTDESHVGEGHFFFWRGFSCPRAKP